MRKRCEDLLRQLTKKGSIFRTTFGGLILMSLVMVIYFGFWMNEVTEGNHRRQLAVSNLNLLRQTDEAMCQTIELLGLNMSQLLWSSDVITYLVNPFHVEQEQTYRIVQFMKSSAENSSLVKKAFLYSPIAGEIFDSKTVWQAEAYGDYSVITSYQEGDYLEEKNEAMVTTVLVREEGRLFLVQDLDISNHIGIVVYELSLDALSGYLGVVDQEGEISIWIYDEDEPVFAQAEEPDWTDAQFLTMDNLDEAASMVQGYYYYTSEKLGWTYLLPMDSASLFTGLGDILPFYLPVSLIFLLVSIFFARYIATAIYRPINHLMNLVMPEDADMTRGGAEVDFLEGAYSDALNRRDQLQNLLKEISPEILDSMLSNLLIGKKLSEERVGQILEGVGNPVRVRDRYTVMVCQLLPTEAREVEDTELNLYLLTLRRLLEKCATENCRLYDIRTDRWRVAVVMAFPEDTPAAAMKSEYARISGYILEKRVSIPFGIALERGSMYQNILDIRYSYQEAVQKLSYERYLTENQDAPSEEEPEQIYFRERAKSIWEQAAQGEVENAYLLIGRVQEDVQRFSGDPQKVRNWIEFFQDQIMEKVTTLPMDETDSARIEEYGSAAALTERTTVEELCDYAGECAREVVRLLSKYSGKGQYRYVEQARLYIEEHYADSLLSLNDVGDHIGISGSYLGEIFRKVTGKRFTAYLAAYRVEKARILLATTRTSVKEIGFLCGFNSVPNFIRVFKKYENQTPGQYREERKN